ncbi:MAG: SPFH domain-containing protein [Acidobacteria bacterium]|nr:SPFH domain-containing protein [Acidobacteriota bacterium]
MIQEKPFAATSGWFVLFALLAVLAGAVTLFIIDVATDQQVSLVGLACILAVPVVGFLLAGLFVVNPNQARVLLLFGRYVGTARDPGLRWANPLYALSGRRAVSLRVRNFETARSKVNDTEGNPIEIAAVVVWKVVDTAEAVFEVDDYIHYVNVQSESAVRNLATRYPYDAHEEAQTSLRGNTEEIAGQLQTEIQGRLHKAGVEVLEARITHLAYAPEIASAMLQRQQAGAIIAARSRIVDGAVSMVQMALDSLSSRNIVELDEERKAAMVSNLLVVLCGDKATQPVVNTGTLHQ